VATTLKAKRIARAYNALADALAVVFWHRDQLARYLRGMLRDVPELQADLRFYGEPKRETAGRLVDAGELARCRGPEARHGTWPRSSNLSQRSFSASVRL
jgi:hypothetical protein